MKYSIKLFFSLLIAFISLIFIACEKQRPAVVLNEVKVEAPFEMPVITIPDYSACKQYSIVDFGALPGNKEKTSLAIEKAIKKASENGCLENLVCTPLGTHGESQTIVQPGIFECTG